MCTGLFLSVDALRWWFCFHGSQIIVNPLICSEGSWLLSLILGWHSCFLTGDWSCYRVYRWLMRLALLESIMETSWVIFWILSFSKEWKGQPILLDLGSSAEHLRGFWDNWFLPSALLFFVFWKAFPRLANFFTPSALYSRIIGLSSSR